MARKFVVQAVTQGRPEHRPRRHACAPGRARRTAALRPFPGHWDRDRSPRRPFPAGFCASSASRARAVERGDHRIEPAFGLVGNAFESALRGPETWPPRRLCGRAPARRAFMPSSSFSPCIMMDGVAARRGFLAGDRIEGIQLVDGMAQKVFFCSGFGQKRLGRGAAVCTASRQLLQPRRNGSRSRPPKASRTVRWVAGSSRP